MTVLPSDSSDADLLEFIDRWALLLEQEDYDGAFALTGHVRQMGWTAELIREVIKGYGDAQVGQHVTLAGVPTDIHQRKEVDWWKRPGEREAGEIWYDLNIDGLASDLTATFEIERLDDGIRLDLNDIHVM